MAARQSVDPSTVSMLNPSELLQAAVGAVLTEEGGFQLNSESAINARRTADTVLKWSCIEENHEQYSTFSSEISKSIESYVCTAVRYNSTAQVRLETIWKAFFQLTSSLSFKLKWENFLRPIITTSPCPIFYQYVTDYIFKYHVKANFPIIEPSASVEVDTLTYFEKNAIRYAAGYVPKALRKKLKKSLHPNKENFISCLDDMLQNEETDKDESEEWTNLIDRGGLSHVSTAMYIVVAAMEIEIKRHLKQPDKLVSKFREQLVQEITGSNDVLFYWSIVAAPWDLEAHIEMELLKMIADLWTTIRGFSYASSWIERYKQATKKTMQKSKGLRKTLIK